MTDFVAQQGEDTVTDGEAFFEMCRASRKVEGMKVGLRQVTKSLIGGRSKLIIMSSAINNKTMKDLIEGLASQYNNVPIYKVGSHEDISDYIGLSKKDETGKIKKRMKCAVISIDDFGEQTQGKRIIFSKLGRE